MFRIGAFPNKSCFGTTHSTSTKITPNQHHKMDRPTRQNVALYIVAFTLIISQQQNNNNSRDVERVTGSVVWQRYLSFGIG